MRVLVFDLDDTLYPERDFVRSGFLAADQWLREQKGIAGFEGQAKALFEAGHRGRIFDEALQALGHPASPDLIARLVELYRDHRPVLQLFPDAASALAYWKARVPLGLLTDGYASTQRRKVEALGIEPFFAAMVYSDDLGREFWKPSPKPFEKIMTKVRAAGRDCVYVGDNPRKDFAGARAMGWQTVRVRRLRGEYSGLEPAPGHGADVEIENLDALIDALPPGQ